MSRASRPARSTISSRRWANGCVEEPGQPGAEIDDKVKAFLDGRSKAASWASEITSLTPRRPRPSSQARRLHGRGRGRRPRLHELSARPLLENPSTNGLELLNGEVKRPTEVVGIFPNDDALVRLVGAILLEHNDEWAVQRACDMTLETMATLSDDPLVGLPAMVI